MSRFDHHILVCNSFRVKGEPQGACHKKGAADLLQYLESEISSRGMNCAVSLTGCFSVCTQGPAMVVYPEGWWYGEVTEDRIDEILDALEEGKAVEDYFIS